jgi:lysine biosynthesis protein LysW
VDQSPPVPEGFFLLFRKGENQMSNQVSTQCPECDNDISVQASNQGEHFICPDCDIPLEIVRMDPLALAQTTEF